MKEGWEYKLFGEMVHIIMGQSPNSDTYNNDSDGLPFFQGNADFGKFNPKVRVFCNAPIRIAEPLDILISVRAPIGAINIADQKCCIGRGLAAIRCTDKTLNKFIYYYLIKSKTKLISQGTGSTFKSIGKDIIKKLLFPVIDLAEQKRIVEELDLLSGIIEKQKQQLKELDVLAQSIFYDMFGDPVTNEKGWEVKKLGLLCKSELGKTINKNKDSGEFYPYLCAINIKWNNIDTSYLKQTRFEEIELERYSVEKGDLLVCEGGDIGRSAIWNKEEKILYQNALHRLRFKGEITALYCLYVLWNLKIQNILDSRYGKGVTIKHLVQTSLYSIPIPVPPLPLQNEFAEKIEAIEKQKEAIIKSIDETQKLFDYTMDKYFG